MPHRLAPVVLAASAVLATPAHAKRPPKPTVVEHPVEDKAGHDAATELDFKRLSATATEEQLTLEIEFWTPWEEVPEGHEYEVNFAVSKPGSRMFLPHGYMVVLDEEDGGVNPARGQLAGTFVGGANKASWQPSREDLQTVVATLDGATLTLTVPWDGLPFEDLWLQCWALHRLDPEDETRHAGGPDVPVPSDFVPNKLKVIEVSRPR